jgi:hypothetical protein
MSINPNRLPVSRTHNYWRMMQPICQALAILAATSFPCRADDGFISSGTIVVVEFAADRFIVAADSRVANTNKFDACKILPLGDKMFVVMNGRIASNPPNNYLDAFAAARTSFDAIKRTPAGKDQLRQVVDQWVETITPQFNEMFKRDPDGFFVNEARDNLLIATFGGVDEKGNLHGYVVYVQFYFSVEKDMPDTQFVPHLKPYVIPWNYDPRDGVWPSGEPDKIGVLEFLNGRTPRAARAQADFLKKTSADPTADVEALRIQAALESAIDWAIHPELIGRPVDLMELRKGGTIHWIHRKPNCPAN